MKIFILMLVILAAIWIVFMYFPCPTACSWLVEMDNPLSKINRSQTIIEQGQVTPAMKVLDVGCGPGRLTIPLAQKVGSSGNIVALDLQQGMIDKIQKKAAALGLTNITYVNTAIEKANLEPHSFDRIFLITVLGEIPNQEQALKMIHQALKPDGLLIITEIVTDPHYQRIRYVENVVQKVGFKKKAIFKDWLAYTIICMNT